jgi:hypothetical protein
MLATALHAQFVGPVRYFPLFVHTLVEKYLTTLLLRRYASTPKEWQSPNDHGSGEGFK